MPFLNGKCPVCGKPIDAYSYAICGGKKYHIECRQAVNEPNTWGCHQGRYID